MQRTTYYMAYKSWVDATCATGRIDKWYRNKLYPYASKEHAVRYLQMGLMLDSEGLPFTFDKSYEVVVFGVDDDNCVYPVEETVILSYNHVKKEVNKRDLKQAIIDNLVGEVNNYFNVSKGSFRMERTFNW